MLRDGVHATGLLQPRDSITFGTKRANERELNSLDAVNGILSLSHTRKVSCHWRESGPWNCTDAEDEQVENKAANQR